MQVLGALGAVALLSLSGGLVWFIHAASRPAAATVQAEGIVALTGGADRIETALRLLAEGRARLLLVTGIGGGAELPALAHLAGVNPAPLAWRVTLDRTATSTRANAEVTAGWAAAHDLRSLIVVTAGYHMPRALIELQRAMPAVRLTPAPVLPPAMQGPGGVRDAGTLRLMTAEYLKFIAASLGLSRSHSGGLSSRSPSSPTPPSRGEPSDDRSSDGRSSDGRSSDDRPSGDRGEDAKSGQGSIHLGVAAWALGAAPG